jgi:nucleotide-binding universal stress UspA family protein
MTKKRVLIPLDGSESSRQILHVVRTYIRPEESEVVLLRVALPLVMPDEHVITPLATSMMGRDERYLGELKTSYVWSGQEQLTYQRQLAEDLQCEAAPLRRLGYTVTTAVLFGEPVEQISDYVKTEGIDLVAMTTHGRTGVSRLVLGSVAETVLRTVGVPVLLLRTATTPNETLVHHWVERRP